MIICFIEQDHRDCNTHIFEFRFVIQHGRITFGYREASLCLVMEISRILNGFLESLMIQLRVIRMEIYSY